MQVLLSRFRQSTLALALLGAMSLALLGSTPASALDEDADNLLSFLVGDYALIGRHPDGGAAYTGTAHIEQNGKVLVIQRKIGDKTVQAEGKIEVPSPPGEGRVLRVRWKDTADLTMSCLISGDLDNFGRLSCLWGPDGSWPKQPGLEAYFSTASWSTEESGQE